MKKNPTQKYHQTPNRLEFPLNTLTTSSAKSIPEPARISPHSAHTMNILTKAIIRQILAKTH